MNGFSDTTALYGFYRHMDSYVLSLARTLQQLFASEPRCILDLGCGLGRFSSALADLCEQATVKGVDASEPSIRFAQALHGPRRNLAYTHSPAAGVVDLPWIKDVDAIVFKGSYHLIEPSLTRDFFNRFENLRSVVIIEKSRRSLNCYPVPPPADRIRQSLVRDCFRVPRAVESCFSTTRFKAASYGEFVQVPTTDYVRFIRASGLTYLCSVTPTDMGEWADSFVKSTSETFALLEENIINHFTVSALMQRRRSSIKRGCDANEIGDQTEVHASICADI